MSGDGVSAELSGGIKIPVTGQLQCWAAGERDIEGRREREMTETWEKRRKWNKWQSEWREKEGGDVEWILEIGAGEIDMKTERIDPDLILENHMVISSSTESWTGEKSLSLLPDPTKPSLPQLTSAQFQWLSLLQTKTSATLTVCRICSAEPKALKKSSSKIKVKFQSDFRPLSGAMCQRLHIHPTLHAVEHVFVTKKKKKDTTKTHKFSQRKTSSNQTTTIWKVGLTVFLALFWRFGFLCEPRVQPRRSFGVVTTRDGRNAQIK